jgi:hypothetical protein
MDGSIYLSAIGYPADLSNGPYWHSDGRQAFVSAATRACTTLSFWNGFLNIKNN